MYFCITKCIWKQIQKHIVQRRRRIQINKETVSGGSGAYSTVSDDGVVQEGGLSSQFFDFFTIAEATNNFSQKLGEGGFGSVYKGKLPSGQEVAIKRLSAKSGQGLKEFQNEVQVISKLQHRNLVQLLGCCIYGEEKLLLYEFMPNKSLDTFLFDVKKARELNWEKRYKIIQGIGRGLLYLHQDSRLRIIHRDLKASNILLDEDFNAKISDFGMAHIFPDHQIQAMTNRIVGTYGYMPPEYAFHGKFSEKSDVFSFGVLLLEIVSGKKNNSSIDSDLSLNFLGYAWTVWKEDRSTELIDPSLHNSNSNKEMLRCIHVGLLCVQELPVDRPTMSLVVTMLSSDSALPAPKNPAFIFESSNSGDDNLLVACYSVNGLTCTNPDAR
ncbi:G-type lectin S-receptor-like serine/threonine-protein kinase SD1-1 [Carex rostrata]